MGGFAAIFLARQDFSDRNAQPQPYPALYSPRGLWAGVQVQGSVTAGHHCSGGPNPPNQGPHQVFLTLRHLSRRQPRPSRPENHTQPYPTMGQIQPPRDPITARGGQYPRIYPRPRPVTSMLDMYGVVWVGLQRSSLPVKTFRTGTPSLSPTQPCSIHQGGSGSAFRCKAP